MHFHIVKMYKDKNLVYVVYNVKYIFVNV